MKAAGTLLLIVLISSGCQSAGESSLRQGKKLADIYCANCHLPVSPVMLDSITWVDHVLPAMAPKLGIGVWQKTHYFNRSPDKKSSGISYEDWLKVVAYYKALAPQKLIPAKRPVPLQNNWSVFRVKQPYWKDTTTATTTLVKIDTINHMIYSGDANSNKLYSWDTQLQLTQTINIPSAPVNICIDKSQQKTVTCIGILKALDRSNGQVLSITNTKKILFQGLPRPVQSVPLDFNRDGRKDRVVCAFGHDKGGLYLFEQTADHKFKLKIISGMPGAEHAVVKDFNRDGWPDIMAMFAQGKEGIWLFMNNKNGTFSQKRLLEFPPVYGSTGFQLIDFNKDGREDILYTCGDNGDYSQILKPYHGIYIFLNKGNFHFQKSYFYPVNGCTKAVAADFDGDGDMDIAGIAFFADFRNNPSESFIYFEQDSLLHFLPHAIPIHQYGRWITMDAGDYDGDNDIDIILGNYSQGFIIQENDKPDWNEHLPFIVLQNQTNKISS